MKKTIKSKALQVNLEATRISDIKLPEKQSELLALSEKHFGIHKRVKEFLFEYNHPYADNEFVANEYRKILLGDFWFFHSQNVESIKVLLDIGQSLLNTPYNDNTKTTVFQSFIEFLGNLTNNEQNKSIINSVLSIIEQTYPDNNRIFIKNANYFKKHFKNLATDKAFEEKIRKFTQKVLQESIDLWMGTSDFGGWYKRNRTLFSKDYAAFIKKIGPDYFRQIKSTIKSAEKWQDLEQADIFYNDIAKHFRQSMEGFEKAIEKFYYIIYLIHLPCMAHLKDHLLWEINRILKEIRKELEPDDAKEFLENIFQLFGEFGVKHKNIVLDCVLTLGKEIIKTKDKKLLKLFEQQLIHLGFVTPGKIFIKNDWQWHTDPNHIKNLRVWLEFIETSPTTFRNLLSALILNLKIGGIFIFDTDLFQRDVSKLLNAEISPIYKQIKQLTRIFPVYFNEIGAEGELRDVTTAMDEMTQRQDKLIHFLRKQIHIESNNTQVHLTEAIVSFWYSLDISYLDKIVPTDVLLSIVPENKWFKKPQVILKKLCEKHHIKPTDIFSYDQATFGKMLKSLNSKDTLNIERISMLHHLNFLLREKYSFEVINITSILKKYTFVDTESIQKLEKLIQEKRYDCALKKVFKIMSFLNETIFDAKPSKGWENIYYKRHVAFGIPSMYGDYREKKFEALGLTFRLEFVASRLMQNHIETLKTDYITGKTLNKIYHIFELFYEGLKLDGITNQGFESNLQMFKYSLASQSFTLEQYINLLRFLEENIKEIINKYFIRPYDRLLKITIGQLFLKDKEHDPKEIFHKKAETFYREMISSAFLIQMLDNFIIKIINSMQHMVDNLRSEDIRNIMTYDPDLIVSPLYSTTKDMDNPVFLGSKAYFLKKMLLAGMPVPPGFVLTTEVFRRKTSILNHPKLNTEIDYYIKKHIHSLEKMTGLEFGNPQKPLLLSVRSGTAISMPGAMNTFLNVGMNDDIVESLSRRKNFGWTSWDCYRRLLQTWGMAYGLDRDIFDKLMVAFKNKYKVDQKIMFSDAQMREMAFAYKKELENHNVGFVSAPFAQLKQAILHVFDSWNSERAKVYRENLQIADEWGTAVIIQKMVLGNISHESGTGVVFTHDTSNPKPGIHLNGDFTFCSQGEDVVAGLVHVLPVANKQIKDNHSAPSFTLENAFPALYKRIFGLCSELIDKLGFNHQEIEFTFESAAPEDFYILQTRDQYIKKKEKVAVFKSSPKKMKLFARGTGIGSGVLNGRLAFDINDLEKLEKNHPNDKRILVRPDTVPDDIEMIFKCDGLITGRGGITSHAAVTASRLEKICVVNCVELIVDEQNKILKVNNKSLKPFEFIAIDGWHGSIYMGHYETELKDFDTLK